jgi:hypothetical protein
VEQAYEI